LVKEKKISEKKFNLEKDLNNSNSSGDENKKPKEAAEFKLISSYPQNINYKNFFYFLLAPTFCYQETYPSSGEFRPVYFILKLLKAFFCLTLIYYVYSESIEPVLFNLLTTPLLMLLIELYFPITLFCLICFYLIFECILAGYAELANFGDRQFYDDWWNSTDLAEFNRRWNKIVHMFLHRHVYLECRNRYNLSKLASTSITFIVSAILHEYVLCILIKLFRPMMFVLMMVQIPLITVGRKYFKNTTFGNLFFWFSNLLGINLIFIIYNREYFTYYEIKHE
jgi:sterol O-acyltransferase